MNEYVETFLRAAREADVTALMSTLAPDAALESPLAAGAVFDDPSDLKILLGAVYTSLRDLTWSEHYQDGNVHVAVGRATVLGVGLHDAMLLDTDLEGRISRIRPHLRPWAGLSAFAIALAPKLARHPGVLKRATASTDRLDRR